MVRRARSSLYFYTCACILMSMDFRKFFARGGKTEARDAGGVTM